MNGNCNSSQSPNCSSQCKEASCTSALQARTDRWSEFSMLVPEPVAGPLTLPMRISIRRSLASMSAPINRSCKSQLIAEPGHHSHKNTSVPPNVQFQVDNAEEDWNFTRPFDFIYIRFMTESIKDIARLFRQAYQ
ncbi:hypothetical protein VTI74DRAFT_4323 [Chaetomium olivicolor]